MKRLLDISLASFALVMLLPVLAIIAILVRCRLGSPILFRQTRPGLHGRPFEMVKFRTMTDDRKADGTLLPDTDRLPSFGRMLRSASLDELPELWNILRGDMSLVGPRPLLMQYLPLYSPEQARRHSVRPGLTGWAQINGRNSLSWAEKFALDTWYVDNHNVWLDFKIMFITARRIFQRDGINADCDTPMPLFRGSQDSLENR